MHGRLDHLHDDVEKLGNRVPLPSLCHDLHRLACCGTARRFRFLSQQQKNSCFLVHSQFFNQFEYSHYVCTFCMSFSIVPILFFNASCRSIMIIKAVLTRDFFSGRGNRIRSHVLLVIAFGPRVLEMAELCFHQSHLLRWLIALSFVTKYGSKRFYSHPIDLSPRMLLSFSGDVRGWIYSNGMMVSYAVHRID